MKKNILISLAILTFGVIMFLLGNYVAATNYQVVATTDNLQKAGEIQDALTMFTRPTIRYVDGSKYMIAIFGTNKKHVDYAAVELVDKGIITDDVSLNLNVNFSKLYKCPPELKKRIDKALENRLKHIEGIYSATVNTDIPNLMFEFDKTPKAEVTILTNKAFDLNRISNNAKTLLSASVPGLPKENIKVNFDFEE